MTGSKKKGGAKSPKAKRTQYIAPKPGKPKLWAKVNENMTILRYRPVFRERKGSFLSRRIRNASACIVAPVYAALEKFTRWTTFQVEDIFKIGDDLHRASLLQLKLRANSSYPLQCACPNITLVTFNATVVIKQHTLQPPIQGGITEAISKAQIKMAEDALWESHGIVIQCSGKTFAFWKKGKYYVLIPEGFYADRDLPALLRADSLQPLIEAALNREQGTCNVYSLKIVSKSKIALTLANIDKEFEVGPVHDDIEPPPEPKPIEHTEPELPAPKPKAKEKKKEPEQDAAQNTEDLIISLSADFREFPDGRSSLVGKAFCDDPDRLLHTNIAAAIFLYHFPANLWTSLIIQDIITLGKKIFSESEDSELIDNEELLERVKFPINFMRKDFSALLDKTVFGRVTSAESQVLSIFRGLEKFFGENDIGVIIGPQMVLVWQLKNNYFMFDPKERDNLGRKWTRLYSSDLGSTALSGSACVTVYQTVKKLADVYTDNISLKHRKDTYYIVKVTIYETIPLEEDFEEWRGMPAHRWILVGTKTICDYSYADDKFRIGKAMCIGVAAIVRAMEEPEAQWGHSVIDDMLAEGIELFKESYAALEDKSQFLITNIKRQASVGGRRLRIVILACAIAGTMMEDEKNKTAIPLKQGLSDFFQCARYGILTVKEVALGLWRGTDNSYYILFPYEKPIGGVMQCLCAYDENLPPMGIANCTRFATLDDLYIYFATCLNTKESDQYCLHTVDIVVSGATGRPPLYNFEEFGESGAIIRPYKGLHEGHEMFGVRADKQTLANLLTAIGFNRIVKSPKWTPDILNDILYIGDKTFCRVFMALPECQARDYQLLWDHIKPVIGANKFTFTRTPIVGVIEIQPEIPTEEEGAEGEEEEEEGVEGQDDELFVPPEGGEIPDFGPESKDMMGILTNWFKRKGRREAIAETDFFRLAIWEEDDLLFVFDPKASGPVGEITERRFEIGKDNAASDYVSLGGGDVEQGEEEEAAEAVIATNVERPLYIEKRTYNMFDNEGTAYCAWFNEFDEFYQHIHSKVPPDYIYGRFILHDLTITNTPASTADVEIALKPGYRNVSAGHTMLRGSITQNDPSLVSRGKQELSNCIVALAFAKITPSAKMTTTLLDVILKYGDRLYAKSEALLKKEDLDRYCSLPKLTLAELSKNFSIYKIKFTWKVDNPVKGHMNLGDLKRGMGKMATVEVGGARIITLKGYTFVFYKSGPGYYLYDPFESDPRGKIMKGGLPNLSRFQNVDNLFGFLINKLACIQGSTTFYMYPISIKSRAPDDLQINAKEQEQIAEKTALLSFIPKDQEPFQPYMENMQILRSPITTDKIPQKCFALAALVHSRMQMVELWTQNVGLRISFLASCLLQQSPCQMETRLSAITFDDIRCSFVVDNEMLCHIDFNKNVQGPIYSVKRTEIVGISLKNSLLLFFKSCYMVLISMPALGTTYALWKEFGKYYLFGIDVVVPEMFLLIANTLPDLYNVIEKGTSPEGDASNWYELRSVSVTAVPIRESLCQPLSTVHPSKNEPLGTKDISYYKSDSDKPDFFSHVTVKPDVPSIEGDASEYVGLYKNVKLLYTKEILKCHKFFGTRNFFPCMLASCVASCAFSKVKAPSSWTRKTLEQLLDAGTTLFINSVASAGTRNLDIVDFKGTLYIAGVQLDVSPRTPMVESPDKDKLLICLLWIIKKFKTSFLYTTNYCFAIIYENQDYYLYYPGSLKPLCDDVRYGTSCLLRFCTLSELLDRVLEAGDVASENVYIGPITINE